MDLDRSRLFLVLGTVLLVGSAWSGYQVWDVDYVHSLGDDENVTFDDSRENHVAYEALSAHGQQVVDRTIARGEYVVETDDARVSQFSYGADAGPKRHVVQRNERNYSILAQQRSTGLAGIFIVPVLFASGLVGLLLCILGILFR